MAFALSHTLAPTSGTISPQDIRHSATLSSFKSQLEDISLIKIFQLSHIVLHSYQSVQCVCISSIVFKNPCRYLSVFWITFSISLYIRCVCLFSTLSRRVGALQFSIIIITCVHRDHKDRLLKNGEPRVTTSTFTQLLSSVRSMLLYVHRDHKDY